MICLQPANHHHQEEPLHLTSQLGRFFARTANELTQQASNRET